MIERYNNNILFVSRYFGFSWLLPITTTEQEWFEAYTMV
jgi:hypothetical protein